MKYFIPLIIPILFALTSCGVDPDDINRPTATRLDSLQGKWRYGTVTLVPLNPTSPPFIPLTIVNVGDTLEFRPDLSGRNQVQMFSIPAYNFTYTLPNDTTLIFNTNPGGTPTYDTAIIITLTERELYFKNYHKPILVPGISLRNYNAYWSLVK